MKRRNFFSWMAGAGLCAAGVGRGALADLAAGKRVAGGTYEGPFFVHFAADGGWDPTGFCDPHTNLHRGYDDSGIITLGGIRYANVGDNAAFFERFADRLLIVNGLDVTTNNHAVGRRYVSTGKQDETHPHWAALAAGTHGPELPLAYVAEASQSATEGVVARSRVSNSSVLADLSFPDRINPSNVEDLSTYQAEPTLEMVSQWRQSRLDRMAQEQHLPRIDNAIDNLAIARSGSNELELLQSYLPEALAATGIEQQMQVALAAYAAGIAISATFGMNGFDTHQNNDANQDSARASFFGAIMQFWDEAERLGVADRVVMSIGSDFGRTNRYNGNNGKDHWPVTSMMLMGQGIEGNRMVGATNEEQYALKVDPNTLAVSDDGVTLTPAHVHAELRKLAGVSDELNARFPLAAEPLAASILGIA
jgi:hypothetical protein